MTKPDIREFTLPTSHRLVCLHTRRPIGIFGFTVNAGSRHELAPEEHGLAHFVEHTIFKGTSRRRSWHINSRMEAVGGELNAYTTKEEITFYSIFPRGNLARAAELLADLAFNATFPQKELDKEREVVLEEIQSYLDTPSELVFDEFENLLFSGTPLGHAILGTEENLRGFDTEACRRYVDRLFTPSRMVLFYAGSEAPERVRAIVSRRFESSASRADIVIPEPALPEAAEVFTTVRDIDSHQAHTVMGARVPGQFAPERHALALLTNIIGGPGMNSRLNTELRERRGLVYSADASLSLMADCGLFNIYFGCNADDTERCSDIARGILRDLAEHPLSPRRLAAAKKQYLGQLAVAAASLEQTILSLARSELIIGKIPDPETTVKEINEVTADQLAQDASLLTSPSSLTLR